MAFALEDLILHRVRRDDYDNVIGIRKPEEVHGGRDYVPALFNYFIDSPNSIPFAAVYKEKFIAFSIAFIIDDGTVWLSRGNRVSEEYEGQGVMKWLLAKMEEHIMETTSVLYYATATFSTSTDTHRRLQEGRCYAVAEREIRIFLANADQLKTKLESASHDSSLTHLNIKQLEDLLKNVNISSMIFCKERIVVDWVPYRQATSNLKYIYRETSFVIGSDLDDGSKSLITFGSNMETPVGRLFSIDLYGNIREKLSHHIKNQLQQNLSSMTGKICVRIIFDKKSDEDFIYTTMEKLGFTSIFSSGCLFVEQQIR